jgi:hypothetical protein
MTAPQDGQGYVPGEGLIRLIQAAGGAATRLAWTCVPMGPLQEGGFPTGTASIGLRGQKVNRTYVRLWRAMVY